MRTAEKEGRNGNQGTVWTSGGFERYSHTPRVCVRQNFPQDGIPDVSACLREKLDREELRSRIRPGMRVVLTAGSRQIAHMPEILQELARFLKGQGAKPYIIPTMGSHGGATAEGQRNILESYGITEEFCECPIFSSMETVEVGENAGRGSGSHGSLRL